METAFEQCKAVRTAAIEAAVSNAGRLATRGVMRIWPNAKRSVTRRVRRFWRGVREWCGDAAYERYLRSKAAGDAAHRPLSAQEFYLEQIERRYSQPNRCC